MAIDTLGAALRQLNRLFAKGVVTGLSDAQLLERFLTQRDAGAFEALVGRPSTHPFARAEFEAMYRDSLKRRNKWLSQFVDAPQASSVAAE